MPILLPWVLGLSLAADAATGDATKGKAVFQAQCALCHALDQSGGQGPGLGGVLGRSAAALRGFSYSKALRHSGLHWDTPTLDRFLANPTKVVPGTQMPIAVASAVDRRNVIAYLASLPKPPSDADDSAPPAKPPAASPAPQISAKTSKVTFSDFRSDAPGVSRKITVDDLPPPFATTSSRNGPFVVEPPEGGLPQVPPGFHVEVFAKELDNPRLLRTAPNGDVFLAESSAGKIVVFRAADGSAKPERTSDFARDLQRPFGIAFYPPGPHPTYVYVAETNAVIRFPYQAGDLVARGPAETLVPKLGSGGGHWTRDIAFSPDGARMFVSVGSGSNVAEHMGGAPTDVSAWDVSHGLGATWGNELGRADVRVFNPQGKDDRVFATGIRNCVGLAVSPTGDLWCSTNERDGLGDNLVPDYLTRVREGAFYGWPWFYIGDHEDPRLPGARPDLRGKVTVPDVLVQPHSASLEMLFYEGAMFPADYRGDIFAAFHGSWNRSERTGYKVVRVRMNNGQPTGDVEDFLTGLVVDNDRVWGRPVGVTVAHDGALLVSEDGNGTIWRISYGR